MRQRLGRVVLKDGTAVAYASAGSGRPLVYVMGWLTHLQLGWELPAERALYEALAQGCRLVRYDRVGCGLSTEVRTATGGDGRASDHGTEGQGASDRGTEGRRTDDRGADVPGLALGGADDRGREQAAGDHDARGDAGGRAAGAGAGGRAASLGFELEQLGAVAGTLGEPFDLMGVSMGAPVAVAWAAAHPETVRRLVLYGGWVRGHELASPGVRENVLGLVEAHWGLGSDVLTDIFAPDADRATRAEQARYQRECSSAANARELLALSYDLDVSGLLGQVAAPTLVVHRTGDRAAPVAQAEALAAGIDGAELVLLGGRSHLPYAGDRDELVRVVRRFLGLPVGRRRAEGLTARQREVAGLVSQGLTNREIAARLGIDERSAEGHVERIRLRLGFRSRAQIAAWHSAQWGISPPDRGPGERPG